MDRLKLEAAYLRALDMLMSAIDECQLQVATFRLCRAQARLHRREMRGLHDSERRGLRPGRRMAQSGRRAPALRHLAEAAGDQRH